MNVRTVRRAGGVITVKKPHDIITAKFKLSAREQDLITLAMMEVKKDADSTKVVRGEFNRDNPDKYGELKLEYSIPEEKVAELFDVSLKALKRPTENGIPMLLNVCASLRSRTFIVNDGTGEGFVDGLVNFADYRDGRLLLAVSQKQAERMLDYGVKNNQFGIIDAKLLLSFNSAYTKRVLELISRFKNKKEYKCSVGDLCAMMGTDLAAHDNRADNFRRIVLDNPLKQIIEQSNGVWTPKKGYPKGYHIDTVRGRKMTEKNIITFKMKYNDPEPSSRCEEDTSYAGYIQPDMDMNTVIQDLQSFGMTGVPVFTRSDLPIIESEIQKLKDAKQDMAAMMIEQILVVVTRRIKDMEKANQSND